MKLELATAIAQSIVDRLSRYCEPGRIHIAGSVSRLSPDVKDIEIVCLPLRSFYFDMFNNPTGSVRASAFVYHVEATGKVIKGNPTTGRYCQITLPEGINLDLFMPRPDDYFRQLAIRTGPADYSRNVIAAGWNRLGWVGTPDGLRLRKECEDVAKEGQKPKWKCIAKNPTMPTVWMSEPEFFEWLGIEWIEPSKRN